MEDLLIETLKSAFGYPVRLQGSFLPEEKYPDHFFTFWNDSADGAGYYSGDESCIVWAYSLNFYSVDPAKVSSVPIEAKAALKAAGFIIGGAGHSVASDETTHTGRGLPILYRQNIK